MILPAKPFRTHGLALLAGVLIWALWTADDRAELRRLSADNDALRAGADRAAELEQEATKLKARNDELTLRLPEVNELARLRAKAGELMRFQQEHDRLRGELEKARAALAARQAAPAQNTVTEEPIRTFTAAANVQVRQGQGLITGGWLLSPGHRGFAMVTPVILPDGTVNIESRMLALPEGSVANAGLGELLASGREAERYSIADNDAFQGILDRATRLSGTTVLTAPRMTTAAGREAHIHVGDGKEGVSLWFMPRVQPDGRTLNLDFRAEITPGEIRP